MSRKIFASALMVVFFWSVGGAQDEKLQPLTVSYASVTGTRIPLWIAKDLGLFEKYGLDVRLVYIASGSIIISALLAGNVDLIASAGSSIVTAAARGAPLVIIGTDGPGVYFLVAHPSINSVKDLKGRTVGVSRLGTGPDFLLRRALPKLGLLPGKDVTIVPTGLIDPIQRMLVMLQGKTDATFATADAISRLELQGHKVSVLADFLEHGIFTTISDISTTRQLIKEQRHVVKAFLMGYSEAVWLGKTNKQLTFRIFRKYLGIDDKRALESLYKNNLGTARPPKPYPLEDALQSDIEDLSSIVPELRGKKASDFTDTTLLKEIEDEGFFARLQR